MKVSVRFTARQLELLRVARDRDDPEEELEVFVARALVLDAERRESCPPSANGDR